MPVSESGADVEVSLVQQAGRRTHVKLYRRGATHHGDLSALRIYVGGFARKQRRNEIHGTMCMLQAAVHYSESSICTVSLVE